MPMEAGRTDVPLSPEWCRELFTLQREGGEKNSGLSIPISFRSILNCSSSLIISFGVNELRVFPNKQYGRGLSKVKEKPNVGLGLPSLYYIGVLIVTVVMPLQQRQF